jgi:hypothetical protein
MAIPSIFINGYYVLRQAHNHWITSYADDQNLRTDSRTPTAGVGRRLKIQNINLEFQKMQIIAYTTRVC